MRVSSDKNDIAAEPLRRRPSSVVVNGEPDGRFGCARRFDAMPPMGSDQNIVARPEPVRLFLVFKPQFGLARNQHNEFVLRLIVPEARRACLAERNDPFDSNASARGKGLKDLGRSSVGKIPQQVAHRFHRMRSSACPRVVVKETENTSLDPLIGIEAGPRTQPNAREQSIGAGSVENDDRAAFLDFLSPCLETAGLGRNSTKAIIIEAE